MANVSFLTSPQPHLIPGYTGYCPQLKYRCGETYGNLTHELLLDPTIISDSKRPKPSIETRRMKDGAQMEVIRPAKDDIDIINSRSKRRRHVLYKYPLVPGYTGFMPNFNARVGQRFTVNASEGLADFERKQLKDRAAMKHLKMIIERQRGCTETGSFKDHNHLGSEYKMPLNTACPDYATISSQLSGESIEEAFQVPQDNFKDSRTSRDFTDDSNNQKQFISNCKEKESKDKIPLNHTPINLSHEPMTNSTLCDFTSNYQIRQRTEWSPTTISRPELPYPIQSPEIYHKHVGHIPNYLGHIPGAGFRYGSRFGADTKDAKRWLQGDYSIYSTQCF